MSDDSGLSRFLGNKLPCRGDLRSQTQSKQEKSRKERRKRARKKEVRRKSRVERKIKRAEYSRREKKSPERSKDSCGTRGEEKVEGKKRQE